MRKRQKIMKNSAKKSRHLVLTVVVIAATAILATGAVISRQKVKMKEDSNNQGVRPTVAAAANRNYVTVKVAGQDVQVDSQTGQIKALTPEEAQKLATGLKQVINQSTEGLVETQHLDGSVSLNLEGRFQNVAVARKNDDGSVEQGCVDNAQSAGEFFGIDPQLIENPSDSSKTGTKQPLAQTPRN